MSQPYTPALVAKLLRAMTDDELARVTPLTFQTGTQIKVLPTDVGRRMIDDERAARRGRG